MTTIIGMMRLLTFCCTWCLTEFVHVDHNDEELQFEMLACINLATTAIRLALGSHPNGSTHG